MCVVCRGPDGAYAIGNDGTKRREIIEGIPTMAWFQHIDTAVKSQEPPTFARMKFTFNGKELTFRNVKVQDNETYQKARKPGSYPAGLLPAWEAAQQRVILQVQTFSKRNEPPASRSGACSQQKRKEFHYERH